MNGILIMIISLCSGITLTVSITIFIFGYNVLSTKFHALFWFVIFLTSFFFTFEYLNIRLPLNLAYSTSFFIPVFYILFLLIHKYEKFKIYFLLPLVIGLIPAIFFKIKLLPAIYELVMWTLIILTQRFFKKKEEDPGKYKAKIKLSILVTLIATVPFIVLDLLIYFIFKKENIFPIKIMIIPFISAAAILVLYFSYYSNLLVLNHNYYQSMDFFKKSSAYEKKTIIEKLAASMVHEIKNPITAVQSITSQLKEKIADGSGIKYKKYFEIISSELDKMKELADAFLKSCRKSGSSENETVNLKQAVNNIFELIKYDLDKNGIKISINIDTGHYIDFNSYNFRQIMLNMIYNALEAGAGRIKIYTEIKNSNINLYINDNGGGIAADDGHKIFDPFFTTKLNGTGMGLSICREILNDNFGSIELVSGEKGNTSFSITIKEKKI